MLSVCLFKFTILATSPFTLLGDRDGAHLEESPQPQSHRVPAPQPVFPRGGADVAGGS